jgi:hypothetical protein
VNLLVQIKIQSCVTEILQQFKKGKTQTSVRFFELDESSTEIGNYLVLDLEAKGFHSSIDNLGIVTAWIN